MADEVNTTQSAAAPAASTPQTAPEAAPTQEQQNAFQRFLSGLLGGKAPAAPAEGAETDTPPAAQPEPEAKTYTEADLQARLEAAKAEWAAQQQEQGGQGEQQSVVSFHGKTSLTVSAVLYDITRRLGFSTALLKIL